MQKILNLYNVTTDERSVFLVIHSVFGMHSFAIAQYKPKLLANA